MDIWQKKHLSIFFTGEQATSTIFHLAGVMANSLGKKVLLIDFSRQIHFSQQPDIEEEGSSTLYQMFNSALRRMQFNEALLMVDKPSNYFFPHGFDKNLCLLNGESALTNDFYSDIEHLMCEEKFNDQSLDRQLFFRYVVNRSAHVFDIDFVFVNTGTNNDLWNKLAFVSCDSVQLCFTQAFSPDHPFVRSVHRWISFFDCIGKKTDMNLQVSLYFRTSAAKSKVLPFIMSMFNLDPFSGRHLSAPAKETMNQWSQWAHYGNLPDSTYYSQECFVHTLFPVSKLFGICDDLKVTIANLDHNITNQFFDGSENLEATMEQRASIIDHYVHKTKHFVTIATKICDGLEHVRTMDVLDDVEL